MPPGDKPVIEYRDPSKDRADRAAGVRKALGQWVAALIELAVWMFILFKLPFVVLWFMQKYGPLRK